MREQLLNQEQIAYFLRAFSPLRWHRARRLTHNGPMQAPDILHFWFQKLTPEQHFAQDAALAFLTEPGAGF